MTTFVPEYPVASTELSKGNQCRLQYLSFLLLRGHNQELGSGVNNLELANNGGGIVGHEQLLHMVDNDLVAT